MYKGSSDLAQSRNGRKVVGDAMVAAGRNEIQTFREELASVQAAIRNVEKRILAAPRKSPERLQLGQHKQVLARRSKELKTALYGHQKRPGAALGEYFINAARDLLSVPVFNQIKAAANAAYHAEHDAREASQPATDPDIAA